MKQLGNGAPRAGEVVVPGSRPLSARSVVASTLLGMDPPAMEPRLLVRSGRLFGIADGTTRTALSRMVAAGELEVVDGRYRVAGDLLDRHRRQRASRSPTAGRRWNGEWELAVVTGGPRDAEVRTRLRAAMRRLQFGELREGTWLRPDNLDPDRSPAARAEVADQCAVFRARPAGDPAELVAGLWDLASWADHARRYAADLDGLRPRLDAADPDALARGFVLAAAAVRHLVADPRLPDRLLPEEWPAPQLRTAYDRYVASFTRTWRDWFRAELDRA